MPIRRGPFVANPEESQFCQSGGILFFSNLEGPVFTKPEGSHFANPEGSCFWQSGGVLVLSIRRSIVLSRLKKTTEKKVVKGIRLLRDRLGASDCTGNLPFIKKPNQNKTGLNSDIRDTKSKLNKSV